MTKNINVEEVGERWKPGNGKKAENGKKENEKGGEMEYLEK